MCRPLQPVRPGEGRELRTLFGTHDIGRAEAVVRLVQRLETEVGLKRVRDALGQYVAGEPVRNGKQVEEASSHRYEGDVGAPYLVGSLNPAGVW